MARSYGQLKVTMWAPGSDFRNLPIAAQWVYEMLISQPQISNLGILPYTPDKWVRLAVDLTRSILDQALTELAERRYLVIDPEAGELLVRTFITHDKVWSQPKLVTNARELIQHVESPAVRETLVDRHAWLVNDWSKQQIHEHETARSEGVSKPLSEGVSEKQGSSTGAGDGSGVGVGKNALEGPSKAPPNPPASTALELVTTRDAPDPSPRKRDPIWDFVSEIEGEPLPRHRTGRGRIVADLKTLLRESIGLSENDQLPEDAVDEIRARHAALAREWGERATIRALVQHWERAGRLAHGTGQQARPVHTADRILRDLRQSA